MKEENERENVYIEECSCRSKEGESGRRVRARRREKKDERRERGRD